MTQLEVVVGYPPRKRYMARIRQARIEDDPGVFRIE